MGKAVKLADIAEKLGVSVVTVSKALSGQKGVGEELRAKIVALADELGYRLPSAAEKINTNKGQSIGILIHEKHFSKYNSFYLQMYQMLSVELSSAGYFNLLELVQYDSEKELILPNLVIEGNVSGVIFLGQFSREYCDFVRSKLTVPVQYLDFNDNSEEVHSIVSDNFYGGYYLTNYLFDNGHTDIAFVGSVLKTSSITDRYLGYLKSMMEHGKKINDKWIIEDRDEKTGIIFSPEVMQIPKKMPTAFVCNCDLTAGVLIKKLEKEGYKVPDDISVVGYDNFIFPGTCDIEITTYEVDMPVMVKKTVEILDKLIRNKEVSSKTHIVTGHLVEKKSVKKLFTEF
ncbi:LacI family DNA-binding transcriptional regulator [Butyrivibrio sp. JL13D10]|uniref:LacI family DNA-binding transcriptional regulator n=1 Tax=Butyrivibrio sp. JL13D10 TaxID=3236815 RepID=UPI0038B5E2C9